MSSERLPPDDRELEDFLAGRHPVGHAYREGSENETAPPELDAAILAAARDAVRRPVVRRPRWIQPVALAATLVLGVSVLMNLWREPQTREQIVPGASPAPQPITKESEIESHGAPSAAAEAAAAKSAPIETPEKKKLELPAPKPGASADDAAAPPPPPASGDVIERDQPQASRFEMPRDLPSRDMAPAMAPPAASAPALAEPDARRESEARERIDQEQRQRSTQKAMPAAPAQGSADGLGASGVVPESRSVEQWIAQIRAEIARGDESEARDSLQDFRREYPDVVLPPDLTAFERAER